MRGRGGWSVEEADLFNLALDGVYDLCDLNEAAQLQKELSQLLRLCGWGYEQGNRICTDNMYPFSEHTPHSGE